MNIVERYAAVAAGQAQFFSGGVGAAVVPGSLNLLIYSRAGAMDWRGGDCHMEQRVPTMRPSAAQVHGRRTNVPVATPPRPVRARLGTRQHRHPALRRQVPSA